MWRGLHVEWPKSVVFISVAKGVYCRSDIGAKRSTTGCVHLVGGCPWWRCSGGLFDLQRVAA
jgi:hypothetical protein